MIFYYTVCQTAGLSKRMFRVFYCESIYFFLSRKHFWAYGNCREYLWSWVNTFLFKKTIQAEANRTGISSSDRGENASPKTHPAKDGSACKRRKQYVDRSKSESKTCMIHGDEHSSDECKVLGEFGTKYAASYPTKDRGSNLIPRIIFHKNKKTRLLLTICLMKYKWVNPKKSVPWIMKQQNFWKVIKMGTTCIRWIIWVLVRLKKKLNDISVRLNKKIHMLLKSK